MCLGGWRPERSLMFFVPFHYTEVFYVPSSLDHRYDFVCVCVIGNKMWLVLNPGDLPGI